MAVRLDLQPVGRPAGVTDRQFDDIAGARRRGQRDSEPVGVVREGQRPTAARDRVDRHAAPLSGGRGPGQIERRRSDARGEQAEADGGHAGYAVRVVAERDREPIVLHVNRLARVGVPSRDRPGGAAHGE